jgi:hypothetical protein
VSIILLVFVPGIPVVAIVLNIGKCPKTRNDGPQNPKKMCGFNKSIYPLNKTFLLLNKPKKYVQKNVERWTSKPKKKCFHFRTQAKLNISS